MTWVNPSCSGPGAPSADCELWMLLPAGGMYGFFRADLYPVLLVYCRLLTTSPML